MRNGVIDPVRVEEARQIAQVDPLGHPPDGIVSAGTADLEQPDDFAILPDLDSMFQRPQEDRIALGQSLDEWERHAPSIGEQQGLVGQCLDGDGVIEAFGGPEGDR
jgi:hypothetical protein